MRIYCLIVIGCVGSMPLIWAMPAPPGEHPTTSVAAAISSSANQAVDLRSEFDRWNLDRRRQGDRPTCSAFTVAGAIEFAMAKRQGHGTRLSVDFLNWAANQTCGDAEDGGFFSDLWKGYRAHGICIESNMPYQAKFDPKRPPSTNALSEAKSRLSPALRLNWIKEWNVNTGLTDEHLAAIKRTLEAGWPVCGGFRWPKKEAWVGDVLQMCPSNSVRDGHSVLLVGYREDASQPGGGIFIFRNTARNARDGYMPYEYACAYMNDAAWVDFETGTKARSDSRAIPRYSWDPRRALAELWPLRARPLFAEPRSFREKG